tara:strand:+ start:4063 stop:4686 length:624 start_codon:yes stop_codon:yes gene_type:complete
MKRLDDYFSVGKKAVIPLSLVTVLGLTGCELPSKVAEELVNMTYRVVTFPVSLGEKPSVNGCIENLNEKVCKLYLRKKIDTNPDIYEECFGVLEVEIEKKEIGLVLGYYDGDMMNLDGEKVLTIVEYRGNKREDFITPYFGKIGYSYNNFIDYFESIKVKKLDTSENPLKEIMEKGLIDAIKINIFRKKLHKRIGECLRLLDEESQK